MTLTRRSGPGPSSSKVGATSRTAWARSLLGGLPTDGVWWATTFDDADEDDDGAPGPNGRG